MFTQKTFVRMIAAAFLFAAILLPFNSSFAQEDGLVTVQSSASYDETISSLKRMVSQNDMMVLSEIDQGNIMSMAGMQLKATSLFVGNPTVGQKLFEQNHGAGLVVPVRVNVYEGNDGNTYVNYFKPSVQLSAYEKGEFDELGKMLDETLGMMTSMLAN